MSGSQDLRQQPALRYLNDKQIDALEARVAALEAGGGAAVTGTSRAFDSGAAGLAPGPPYSPTLAVIGSNPSWGSWSGNRFTVSEDGQYVIGYKANMQSTLTNPLHFRTSIFFNSANGLGTVEDKIYLDLAPGSGEANTNGGISTVHAIAMDSGDWFECTAVVNGPDNWSMVSSTAFVAKVA